RVLVRIRGIDAPEMRGRCPAESARAEHAAAALRELVSEGTVLLTGIQGEKYFGRVLADVATPGGGNLATALIAGGYARAYDGGVRRSWCEIGALDGGEEPRARYAAE
ncbi:MAG: thermonuclease family protein, partial [Propylenella sp.]